MYKQKILAEPKEVATDSLRLSLPFKPFLKCYRRRRFSKKIRLFAKKHGYCVLTCLIEIIQFSVPGNLGSKSQIVRQIVRFKQPH